MPTPMIPHIEVHIQRLGLKGRSLALLRIDWLLVFNAQQILPNIRTTASYTQESDNSELPGIEGRNSPVEGIIFLPSRLLNNSLSNAHRVPQQSGIAKLHNKRFVKAGFGRARSAFDGPAIDVLGFVLTSEYIWDGDSILGGRQGDICRPMNIKKN
jgi:hypothetical protein